MTDNTYKTVSIQNGVSYKPVYVKPNKSLCTGQYNNLLIFKFLVLANSASNIKIWTAGVDVDDPDAGISIPSAALIVGREYELTVGKITYTGTLNLLGYQLLYIPVDYPNPGQN